MERKIYPLKIIIFLFLFFSSTSLLLGETYYYEATEFGTAIREISSARVKEFEYVLMYEKNGNRVLRQLLQNGVELKKWEQIIKWKGTYVESEFNDGIIVNRIHVEGNFIVKEELFFEGLLSEIRTFIYIKRELSKMIVQDATGKELYTNRYLTASNGRLTRVVQEFPKEMELPESVYSYQYADNDLSRMVAQEKKRTVTYAYIKGKLASVEKKEGDEVYYYREEPLPGVLKTVENDFVSDLKIERSYDEDDKLFRKVIWSNLEKTIFDYTYDENGYLAEEQIRGKGFLDRYFFKNDDEGNRITHEYFRNTIKLRTAKYTSAGDYIEIIYREDLPLFRVTYKDNVKILTEFISILGTTPDDESETIIEDDLLEEPIVVEDENTVENSDILLKNEEKVE